MRLRPVWILSATRAGPLLQLADHQGVDVFIGGAFVEGRRGGLGANGIEGRDDLRALLGGQNADAFERAREGLRAADIGVDQPPVEIERAREALEDLRRSCFEIARPRASFGFARGSGDGSAHLDGQARSG